MKALYAGLLVLLITLCSYSNDQQSGSENEQEVRAPYFRARFTSGVFAPDGFDFKGRFLNLNIKHSSVWEKADFGNFSVGGSGEFGINSFTQYFSFLVTYAKVGPEIRFFNFYIDSHVGVSLVTIGVAGIGADGFYGFNAGYIQHISNRFGIELEAGRNHSIRTKFVIDYISIGLTIGL